MAPVAAVAAATALALVAGAAAIDCIRREIPDAISIAVVVAAVVFGVATPAFSWWSHAAAPPVIFGFGLLAFSRGWLGGGDVKLLTAIAAWTGLGGLALMFVATSVAGGGLTAIMLAARRLGGGSATATMRVPYAVAIAVGTAWWLWATGGGPAAH